MNNIPQSKLLPRSVSQTVKAACLLGLVLLLTLLTSCGILSQQPPNQAVRLAVSQQLSNLQNNIAQGLGIDEPALNPNFKIDKLEITSREKVSNPRFQQKGYPSDIYKVRGTVETTLTAASRKIQQTSPFEIYLGTNALKKAAKKSEQQNENRSKDQSENEPENKPETWYLIAPDVPKPLQ